MGNTCMPVSQCCWRQKGVLGSLKKELHGGCKLPGMESKIETALSARTVSSVNCWAISHASKLCI